MESLFSLEIHVESVEALQVIFRLPAVSFRLLDYPTLIIHHVKPIMAEKLRHKVLMDSGANESVLQELKDRRGNFQFEKGKSCLFKANIDVLQTQLQMTPLYVMLLDLWPKKCKLVGSGGIQMNTAINAIHKQVKAKGVAVPSFYKEFGDFDLFNLMGSAVARVKLGYRLVSLGGSLIPHVPTTTGSRREESQSLTESIKEEVLKDSDVVIREPTPAETGFKKLDFPETKQVSKYQHTHTQTTLVGAKAKPKLPVQDLEEQDLVITNTVCPPPLYFNSLSELQTKSSTELGYRSKGESPVYDTNTGYLEDDVDSEYDHASVPLDAKVHCTSVSIQTDPTVVAAQQTDIGHQNEAVMHQQTNELQNNLLRTVMETVAVSRYPVLNALFEELSSVTMRQHKDTKRETGLSKGKGQRSTGKPAKSHTSQKGPTSTKKLTAPIAKNSSVIGLPRQRVRFRPTSLTYKTTRTQQMRLEQNLRGQVDKVRLCAAVNQHGMGKETPNQTPVRVQHVWAKESMEQTPVRDMGRTYKTHQSQIETHQSQIETIVKTAEKQEASVAKDKATTHNCKDAGNETQGAEIHRTSHSATSPAGSIVDSARSYKSQNSLEIFLPTADGETDDNSCTEAHPPLDSKFGHTGIPNLDPLPSDTQLLSTVTSHCQEFDDTTSWRENKTAESMHSSLESPESYISDIASEQSNGAERSANFRPPISKSPQKISQSHRPKSANSLIQKVSLSDAYPRETRSSSDIFNSEEMSQQVDKQSLSPSGSTVKEKESASDENYSDDFHSGSEAEQSESQLSD